MKTTYLILILICLTVPNALSAQIGGSIFEIARKANDESKTEDEKRREAAEMRDFEGALEQFGKTIMDPEMSDKPLVGRCLELMSKHAAALVKQQGLIEETGDCTIKRDLLQAQALLVLSGGTIIYCPDEFNSDKIEYGKQIIDYFTPYLNGDNSLSQDEKDHFSGILERQAKASAAFGNRYRDALKMTDLILKDIEKTGGEEKYDIWNDLANDEGEYYEGGLENLVGYFTYFLSPEFMAKRANEINQQIKGLPCD